MELDLALLEAAQAGEGPFLRLYAWDGPWISLGYFQRELADARGVPVVRRPTGGKALLHDRDLTYAVALPAAHPLAQLPVVACYRALSERLVRALEVVGVRATLGTLPPPTDTREKRRAVPCATEVHVDSVLVDGRKLVGSAQVRRHGAVLQHGSIPLGESAPEVLAALAPDEPSLAQYRARTTALTLELRVPLEAALIEAFADL